MTNEVTAGLKRLLVLGSAIVAFSACGSSTGGAPSTGGGPGHGGATGVGGTGGGSDTGGFHTGGFVASGGTVGKGGTAGTGAGGALAGAGGSIGTGGASSSADAAPDAYAVQDSSTFVDVADVAIDVTAVDAASFPGTNNPVLPGLFADPAIAVFDGTFYIYPTTDGFADWKGTSFSVFASTNLVRWTNQGVVLNVATDLKWATDQAWAPSIARVGGTYYYYFTAHDQIGVATGKSPTGPFKDALGKPLVSNSQYGVNSIDPNVFIDDDGTAYLSFGNSGLRLAKLNADMVSFSGEPADITPTGGPWVVIEGSAMFKRKGTYYLQWSEGGTGDPTYRVAYARAQSPLGPFTRLAVILEQNPSIGVLGPGGSTVLGIPSRDEYYITYHRFKIPGGDGTHRETCIDRLYFAADGTIVPVKPTLQGLQTAVSP